MKKISVAIILLGVFFSMTSYTAHAGWKDKLNKIKASTKKTVSNVSKKITKNDKVVTKKTKKDDENVIVNIHPDDKKHIKDFGKGSKGYIKGTSEAWKDSKGKGVIDRTGDAVIGGSIGFAKEYLKSSGTMKDEDVDNATKLVKTILLNK